MAQLESKAWPVGCFAAATDVDWSPGGRMIAFVGAHGGRRARSSALRLTADGEAYFISTRRVIGTRALVRRCRRLTG